MELACGILIGIALSALAIYASKKFDIPTSIEAIKPVPTGGEIPQLAQIIKKKSPEQEIDELLK